LLAGSTGCDPAGVRFNLAWGSSFLWMYGGGDGPFAAGRCNLESIDLAKRIVDLASDKLAESLVLLDVRELTSIADYFVICNGGSDRQVRAISRQIQDTLALEGEKALHEEGESEARWILVDYSSVIVHIFTPEERDYYRLDRLWGEAPTVVKMQ
jgi:ribosome-associated protein